MTVDWEKHRFSQVMLAIAWTSGVLFVLVQLRGCIK